MKKILLLLLVLLVGCQSTQEVIDIPIDENNVNETTTDNTTSDEETTKETSNVTKNTVQLNGDSIETSTDLTFSNNKITITKGGTYEFFGTLDQGQILVETQNIVHIILNGVIIHNDYGPAIEIKKAESVIITLADGSENYLSDGLNYVFYTNDDEPNATLYSKSDLTLDGNGSLSIEANFKNGILSKDNLIIESGTYTIIATNDAIRGRDSIQINNGVFNLTTDGDGIQSNNDTDSNLGWIKISNGEFIITSQGKGIKAVTNIVLEDGQYDINSDDDSIHSNGDITVAGGNYTLNSGDDGVHADSTLLIEDGEINIVKSYEGLEASTLIINNGTINLVASDDGINAAGGNDTISWNQDSFATGNHEIIINGGNITVDAQGDGIDANGNLTINGGNILIHGPSSNGNGALDYDGQGIITGGNLIAYGSGGMAQSMGSYSTQNVLEIRTNNQYPENTEVIVLNQNNEIILSFISSKSFSSIVLSSPNFILNQAYTIKINQTETATFNFNESLKIINEYGEDSIGGNMFQPMPGNGMNGPRR